MSWLDNDKGCTLAEDIEQPDFDIVGITTYVEMAHYSLGKMNPIKCKMGKMSYLQRSNVSTLSRRL